MKYLFLLIFFSLKALFAMDCSPKMIMEKIVSKNTKALQSQKSIGIEESIKKILKDTKCSKSDDCSSIFESHINSIKNMLRKHPNGEAIIKKYLQYYTRGYHKQYPEEFERFMNFCIGHHKNCDYKQITAFFGIVNSHKKMSAASSYLLRKLSKIKHNKLDDLQHSDDLITKKVRINKVGKISGKIKKVEKENDTYFIDGEKIPSEENNYAKSIERESKAIKLLAQTGLDIKVVPTLKSERIKLGIEDLFSDIRQKEKLQEIRAADVLINDKFLLDIYSPQEGIHLDNLDLIVQRTLIKTEGKKQQIQILNDTESGKRQTSRVLIYTESLDGDFTNILKGLREKIIENDPAMVDEIFILLNKEGRPKIYPVWPF